MHPPPLNPNQDLLSDWPDCQIETRCGCERSTTYPIRLMIDRHGDAVVGPAVRRLRCRECGARPAQAWVVAGPWRTCHGGPTTLDWAVEIKLGV